MRGTAPDNDIESNKTIMSRSQSIQELTNAMIDGVITIPIEFELPSDVPVSFESEHISGVSVTTMLTISLVMGDPLHTAMVRDYPIRIIKPLATTVSSGIMQSIEFPCKGCCSPRGYNKCCI